MEDRRRHTIAREGSQDRLAGQEGTQSEKDEVQSAPGGQHEQEIFLEVAKTNPDSHLVHVAEAAKRNEAIERLYELRQEVKDQAQSGMAVSAVEEQQKPDQEQSQHQYLPPSHIPPQPPPLPAQLTSAQNDQSEKDSEDDTGSRSSTYRNAILGGFVAGLVVAAILILLMFI